MTHRHTGVAGCSQDLRWQHSPSDSLAPGVGLEAVLQAPLPGPRRLRGESHPWWATCVVTSPLAFSSLKTRVSQSV